MLYTDHQALLKCLKIEDATGRLARWQLALSEYDLGVFHVPNPFAFLLTTVSSTSAKTPCAFACAPWTSDVKGVRFAGVEH